MIKMNVPFSYLDRQFCGDLEERIFKRLRDVVKRGDYTLGREVKEFEERIAKYCGTKYAIGMSSGTSALELSLKALGIGSGDEIITVPNSFFATTASIVTVGATPVFVDVNDEYLIDVNKIKHAITTKTKAILPVHLTGAPCDMREICRIAEYYQLFVIEDACQAVNAEYEDKKVGSFGDAGCFSMHPLKNLNVMGDGGFITTNSEEFYDFVAKARNHGLRNRNIAEFYAQNERLSTFQAAVALEVLDELEFITNKRIEYAKFYDKALKDIPEIKIPPRNLDKKYVYHLYIVLVEKRDELLQYLLDNGVDAKIHYPIPLHLQPASKKLGLKYVEGDFPVCEKQVKHIISLPLHQHLREEERQYVVETIQKFYKK